MHRSKILIHLKYHYILFAVFSKAASFFLYFLYHLSDQLPVLEKHSQSGDPKEDQSEAKIIQIGKRIYLLQLAASKEGTKQNNKEERLGHQFFDEIRQANVFFCFDIPTYDDPDSHSDCVAQK